MTEIETARGPIPLPAEVIGRLVRRHFGRRERYLAALDRHASPLYLLEPAALEQRAAQLLAAFGQALPAVEVFFAVKSNNHPAVARALVAAGCGLDVSSGVELELALATGAARVVFSGPGKTAAELEAAVAAGDRVTVLIDSFGELRALDRIAAEAGRRLAVGVRLTTNPTGLWRKFGIPLTALGEFARATAASSSLRLAGLQFHTSWNLSPRAQVEFIGELARRLAQLPPESVRGIEFLDVGGGYWPEDGEWLHGPSDRAGRPGLPPRTLGESTPMELFAARIGAAIRERIHPLVPCRVCVEPGRWLSHEAMHLLLTVVDKKAPDLVITDAGTNAIGWERFESDYFPVLNLSRPALTERRCDVLGALCTPHDVWGFAYFGDGIEPGDVLLIPNQGAYTYSLRQQFIKGLPEVVEI